MFILTNICPRTILPINPVCQPFPKQPLVFTCLKCQSFENTVGKREIACNKQFFLFQQCFVIFWKTFTILSNLKLSSANSIRWKSLITVIWERVRQTKWILTLYHTMITFDAPEKKVF